MTRKSTLVKSFTYNSKKQILEIVFHNTEGTYRYFDVEKKRYRGLRETPSVGKYFHKFILNKYKFKKVL